MFGEMMPRPSLEPAGSHAGWSSRGDHEGQCARGRPRGSSCEWAMSEGSTGWETGPRTGSSRRVGERLRHALPQATGSTCGGHGREDQSARESGAHPDCQTARSATGGRHAPQRVQATEFRSKFPCLRAEMPSGSPRGRTRHASADSWMAGTARAPLADRRRRRLPCGAGRRHHRVRREGRRWNPRHARRSSTCSGNRASRSRGAMGPHTPSPGA